MLMLLPPRETGENGDTQKTTKQDKGGGIRI